jgi:hypothetical protein
MIPYRYARKQIIAVGISRRGALAVIEHAIVILVDKNRPTRQARFALLLDPVAVEIVPLLATDRAGRLAVAEVDSRRVFARVKSNKPRRECF